MDRKLIVIGLLFLFMVAIAGCTAPPTTEQHNNSLEGEWDDARGNIWNPLEGNGSSG